MKEGFVFATDADSGAARQIGKLPRRGNVSTVNADETLLAVTYIEGEGPDYGGGIPAQAQRLDQPPNKGQMMEERLAARLPMGLFTMDTRTGEVRTILKCTDWLNHLLFSPTDPTLLMYCHEGPWHKVERIWTIRTDGSQVTKIHTRTMQMEIFGHEFWSADGKIIWYDLQTPRGEDFWLATTSRPAKGLGQHGVPGTRKSNEISWDGVFAEHDLEIDKTAGRSPERPAIYEIMKSSMPIPSTRQREDHLLVCYFPDGVAIPTTATDLMRLL